MTVLVAFRLITIFSTPWRETAAICVTQFGVSLLVRNWRTLLSNILHSSLKRIYAFKYAIIYLFYSQKFFFCHASSITQSIAEH